jgi:alginate O-acetyltransferase complex protein AlgI
MLFSEPSFLFFFLPAVLLLYYLAGERFKNWVLCGASLAFYAWGENAYVVVLLVSILLNWVCGLAVGAAGERRRRPVIVAVVGNLLLLVGFKYTNFLVENLNHLLVAMGRSPLHLGQVHLPIGISFFAFQGMSYVIDVYRGVCPPQKSLLNLAMYKSFFPQLIAGPIVRYADVKNEIVGRRVTMDDFADGIRRFVVGLGKKMIIANVVARPTDQIFALPPGQRTAALCWIAVVGYALQIYFDFSGYSDMAIGLGRMFGFHFRENFDYPYAAVSMTDFWRRWHISLSSWFRDYLYVPLGGNRVSPARQYRNLLTVFFLCGLWHGASWTFVVWGLFHGAFLIGERLTGTARAPAGGWRPLRHLYVVVVVLVSWVFFRASDLSEALGILRALVGLSSATQPAPGIGMFVDREVILAALLGVVAAAPVAKGLARLSDGLAAKTRPLGWVLNAGQVGVLLAVFGYSVMLAAAGSYSPFIYFRF